MESFRVFLEQSEEQEKNIKDTLKKVPKSHRDLIKGYKMKWQCDNVLNGDDKHVGLLNPNNKTITVAAPFFHSREHTFLHELGHRVWEKFVLPNAELLDKWKKIVKNTKGKPNQNTEELFTHSYACYYCKHKNLTFHYPEWMRFIKELPS